MIYSNVDPDPHWSALKGDLSAGSGSALEDADPDHHPGGNNRWISAKNSGENCNLKKKYLKLRF